MKDGTKHNEERNSPENSDGFIKWLSENKSAVLRKAVLNQTSFEDKKLFDITTIYENILADVEDELE